jgi:hypothetical protein
MATRIFTCGNYVRSSVVKQVAQKNPSRSHRHPRPRFGKNEDEDDDEDEDDSLLPETA